MNTSQGLRIHQIPKAASRRRQDRLVSVLRDGIAKREVKQVAYQQNHPFSLLEWVYFDGVDWQPASASSKTTFADGVVSGIADNNEFEIVSQGVLNLFSGLTTGSIYYLSSVSGDMLATPSQSGLSQQLGRALSATEMRVEIQELDTVYETITVEDSSETPRQILSQVGSGDAARRIELSGGVGFTYGIDNSDGDAFKISENTTMGINDRLTIQPTTGYFGFGTTTPSQRVDVNGSIQTNQQVISTVPTGTAPISVASTTAVANLNVDRLDDQHAAAFAPVSHVHSGGDITSGVVPVSFGGTGTTATFAEGAIILAGSGGVYASDDANLHLEAGKLGVGNNDPKTVLHGSGSTIVGCAAAAEADGDLNNSEVNFWVDEGGNSLTFKVKYSDGTVKAGVVALV